MIDNSRINIYDFLYSMFHNVVTNNVYKMERPQELTESDAKEGFIVLRVGAINDESEFYCNAYIWSRVYVEAYIPPKSRGRLDKNKYNAFEKGINYVVSTWNDKVGENGYSIDEETLLSTDDYYASNKDNVYNVLIKSFVVYKNDDIDATYHGDLYIGLGDSILTDKSSVEKLVNIQHYNIEEPSGDYIISFPATHYLWICTTGDVGKVLSSEIEVPMEEPVVIDGLNCYRSSNAILEGTMVFTII